METFIGLSKSNLAFIYYLHGRGTSRSILISKSCAENKSLVFGLATRVLPLSLTSVLLVSLVVGWLSAGLFARANGSGGTSGNFSGLGR